VTGSVVLGFTYPCIESVTDEIGKKEETISCTVTVLAVI